ncbi:MAG TPA: uroporphyrinogen decarboxylase family protein [Anaerolineales bacterium]|nr:uroporphyrinogen decarboxylase family protein [Anaerolineales bacterium]
MNSKERVMCALAGEQPDRVPFCEGSVDAWIARTLAGSKRDLTEREISDMLHRDVVVAVLFPPYFADSEVGVDGQSYVTTGWIKKREDLEKMVMPDPNDPDLYADARQVLAEKGDHAAAAAIKLGVAPMLMSMGLDGFSYALADDPDLVHEVLRRYTDWQIIVTQNLIEMGFDFLWSFDDVAYKSGPFCSKRTFDTFLMPSLRKVAESINIPWIFHSDGNIMPLLDDLLTLGMSGLHPLEPGPMDLATVKEQYGDKVCLIGNVNITALSNGTTEEVEEIVRQSIEVAGVGGGYMVSSANSIPSYANPENLRVMAEAIQKYGKYPLKGD